MTQKRRSFGERTKVIIVAFSTTVILAVSVGFYINSDKDKVSKIPFPVNFDHSIFDETSTTIDNEWWPLPPGKQQTWEGTALEGGELVRRKVVFTVTDMTKEIAGVQCLIGWDTDYANDELTESELLFIAQAKDGTVWHLGESVEHYFFAEVKTLTVTAN